ncbi:MAG: 4Fe-4S binding protein [Candidatus Latescibacterota bacterium]
MPKPKAIVQYNKCDPEKCSPDRGACSAVAACPRDILEQEEPFESPVIFSLDMCQGCGACVPACKLEAVRLG